MEIVVAGAHGKIALLFERLASDAGHHVRGLARNPDHSSDIIAAGAEPVIADLEADDITESVGRADAVVFAAGAGPGSGPERKKTVDLGGALKLIDAAKSNGIARYLMVSSMSADSASQTPGQIRPYYQAKGLADEALVASGLDYTIVRPGRLTDDPPTGKVEVAVELGRHGQIPRADVAAVLLACLGDAGTVGRTFELLQGDKPIEQALQSL